MYKTFCLIVPCVSKSAHRALTQHVHGLDFGVSLIALVNDTSWIPPASVFRSLYSNSSSCVICHVTLQSGILDR
jgi:hypothetical protein